MAGDLLILGAGELGLMLTRSAQKHGLTVTVIDGYADAPAMREADFWHVIDLSDSIALETAVKKIKPDFIIREIESVSTDFLGILEEQGFKVYPNTNAIKTSCDKQQSRLLINKKLKIKTADYIVVSNTDELIIGTKSLGLPCVVKPLSSSSGLGQSIIRNETEIEGAWNKTKKARRKFKKVLLEKFVKIEQELTILMVKQKSGELLTCPPIGYTTKRGDFETSWQPALLDKALLKEAQESAMKIVNALDGEGVWAVEFFVSEGKLLFNEVCPRPHSTGFVTLAGSQSINQFDLHIKAMLGEPIEKIESVRAAASKALLAESYGKKPEVKGVQKASQFPNTSVELFDKPLTKPYRRMGVALAFSEDIQKVDDAKEAVELAAKTIEFN